MAVTPVVRLLPGLPLSRDAILEAARRPRVGRDALCSRHVLDCSLYDIGEPQLERGRTDAFSRSIGNLIERVMKYLDLAFQHPRLRLVRAHRLEGAIRAPRVLLSGLVPNLPFPFFDNEIGTSPHLVRAFRSLDRVTGVYGQRCLRAHQTLSFPAERTCRCCRPRH